MPVHVNLKNPLILDNKVMHDWAKAVFGGGSEFPQLISEKAKQSVIEAGYDGIVHSYEENPTKDEEVIAFHPHQIKSAIGNNGQFDPKDPNITKAAGGEVLDADHPDRAANLAKHMEDSKTPPVLYHGTNVHDEPMGENTRPLGDIDTFDRHAAYKAFGRPEGMDAIGSWFSETPGDHKEDKPGAGQYGNLIYPAHVRITNPWRPKNFDHFLDEMHRAAGRDPKKQRPRGRGSVSELRDKLIRAGHDGIYFDQPLDHKNQSPTWVAFHPHQIKSAIGNNGQFDPKDPNITKAEGGGVKTIKLRGPGDPGKLKNFMDEFHKDTHPHPFGNRERFLNTDTGLPPGEDFATVEASPFDEKIHVSSVSALSKRRGQGTQALQYLKNLSDKHSVPLSLDPVAYGQGGMNDKQLEKWYGGHGFNYDDRSGLMVRPPATASDRVGKAGGGPMFGADFETISRYLGRPVGAGLQTFKPPVTPPTPTPGVAPTPGVITPSSYGVPPGGFPSVTGVGDRDTPGGVVPGPNNGGGSLNFDGLLTGGNIGGFAGGLLGGAGSLVGRGIGTGYDVASANNNINAVGGTPIGFGGFLSALGHGLTFGLLGDSPKSQQNAAIEGVMGSPVGGGTSTNGNNGTGTTAGPAPVSGYDYAGMQGDVTVTDTTNNDGGNGEVSSDGGGMTGGGWGYGGPEGYRGGGMAYAAGGAAVEEPAAAPAADPMNEPGFSTYHGSPHKFDEFDSGKIGTGTGNRNFGEGFYVADHEPEARGFGDAAFKKSSEAFAARALADNGTREKAMKKLRTKFEGQTDSYAALARSAHDILASGDDVSRRSHMYEIKVKAHPDHFMDWDEKIADQHPKVREILSRLPDEALYKNSKLKIDALPGHGVYRRLTDSLGSTKAASDMLAKVGLPGAKYHDGISHADKKKKTYNYVVFDPKNMEVMRRYAQGGEVYSGKHPKHYAAGGSVADDPSTQRALNISAEAQKPKDKWGQNRSLEFNDLASILEGVRSTNLGQMVGRYQHAPAEHATRTMYEDLKKLATEGKVGRKWYEKSSKRILDYVGGNKTQADKFAQLVAIYSPQTTVPVNTSNAMKAYNRASLGHKIWNGDIVDRDKTFNTIKESSDYVKSLGGENAGFTKVPLDDSGKRFLIARHNPGSYENIATADRDLKAHLVMNEGVPFEGRKTNNFYNNLMVHIDKKRLQGSTQDLWMAKAFGFHDPAVGSGAKYDYMERLTEKLANELGWKPHQVQAAIWTAMKTRQESVADEAKKDAVEKGIATLVPGKKPGQTKFAINDGRENDFSELLRDKALGTKVSAKHIKESARDFSDFLDQNLAHVSWESAPSKQIDHLNGIEDLSPEAKAEHHGLTSAALHDKNGNDLLAKYLGMMSPGSLHAHGYWEGKVNPASHLMVGATRIKAAEQSPQIDEPSRELMDIYADAKGLLHKQDGVGYHRPFYNPKITEANGIEYEFGHDLNAEHIKNLGKAIDQNAPGAALIPAGPRKVKVINFSGPENEISHPNGSTYFQDADAPIEAGHTLLKQHKFSRNYKDQRDFHKAVDRSVQGAMLPGEVATQRVFASDGNLRGNNWQVNRNGEDYLQRLRASRRPDVLEYVATVLAPRVAEVDRAFAEKHGLKTDPGLESSIQNAHRQQQPEQVAPQVAPPVSTAGKMTLRNGGGVNAPAAILPSAVDDALRLTAKYQPTLPGRQQIKRGRP
jgi:hypothetical protein